MHYATVYKKLLHFRRAYYVGIFNSYNGRSLTGGAIPKQVSLDDPVWAGFEMNLDLMQ
jgi:hypothetical protein